MGSINSSRNDAPDYLAAFRTETPGRRVRRRNWRAIQRQLESSESERLPRETPRTGGGDLRRLGLATGLAFAIAAAVLLTLQGLGRGLTMVENRQRSGTEAVDRAASPSPRDAVHRRPSARPSALRSPSPSETSPRPNPTPQVPAAAPSPRLDPAPSAAPGPSADGLAAETQLMLRARRAMANGDLETAVEVLELHAARFPTGLLEPERRAYATIASCLRDPDHATAADFLARYPNSPLRPRVTEACTH